MIDTDPRNDHAPPRSIAIIGGGPAGLMAAEALAGQGVQVDLYDSMRSVGRKFLLAGIGGLNLTHAETFDAFSARYSARGDALQSPIEAFPPDAVRAWAKGLGLTRSSAPPIACFPPT